MILTDMNMKFIIVDDMTNMRRTIKNMLRYIGFANLIEAEDGDIALKKITEDIPDFIIADWNMPRMPGIEMVQKVRGNANLSHISVLMVTAEVQEAQIVQAAESDIDGYIIKPFVAKTLEEKIKGILKRKNNPTEFDLILKGGIGFRDRKEYDKAIETFERGLKISAKSARIRHLIGEIYQLKGEIKKAEQFFKEAENINPQYIKVQQSLSDLYQKNGESEKALVAMEKTVKISPNNVARQTALGKLYFAKGDVGQAEKALRIAIKVEPTNASLKTVIGEIYLKGGNIEKAVDAFKQSLELKVDINVYNRLGIALRREGKVKEAISEYQKALKTDPNDEALHYNVGRAYIEANDKPNAVLHFKRALEIDPNFEDVKVIMKKIGY